MAGGRPQEYHDGIPNEVTKYVKECHKKHYLPTIEGLAVHLGFWRKTLYDWADPNSERFHPEFCDIFEQLKAAQASQLIQNGLKGEYNSTITKLMLTKHNYMDKQDITSDEKPIAPLLVRFLDANADGDSK